MTALRKLRTPCAQTPGWLTSLTPAPISPLQRVALAAARYPKSGYVVVTLSADGQATGGGTIYARQSAAQAVATRRSRRDRRAREFYVVELAARTLRVWQSGRHLHSQSRPPR